MIQHKESENTKDSLSWEQVTRHYNIDYKLGKNCLCPFHEDKTPSLSLNEKEPTFNCFGCEAQGDFFDFIALKEDLNCKLDFPAVLQKAESIAGTNYLEKKNSLLKSSSSESKFLDPTTIQKNYTQLEGSEQALDWFKKERNIGIETLKKAHIGFASHPQLGGKAVIHFPYQNRQGEFLNNRIREIGNGKKVMSEKGSKANMFLAPNLNAIQRVFITEGEIDALTLLQHTNEVIGISGANGFQESFMDDFRNIEEVILCGDNDEAGKTFNNKIISLFLQKYPYIQASYIDWNGYPEKYDINDFYLSLANKAELINELKKHSVERTFRKISPLQYFDKNFACTTIYQEKIITNDKGTRLVNKPYIITSERKKIPLDSKKLYENLIIVERTPIPHDHWSTSSVEKFIKETNPIVTLKETFQMIERELRKYLSFEEDRFYKLISLWIIGTYFHRGMISYPYLALNGGKKCGKSKLLAFIEALSFQGLLNVGSTAAATIRLVNSNHITCCVDEAENLNRGKDENVQALLGIYNSGYKQGSKVPKCGHKNKVELFESYSPKAFGGINALNDTTASRCIALIMPPVKNRQNFNREVNSRDKSFLQLRDQLYIHMLTDFRSILKIYSNLESPAEAMNGRDWEMWKPLITLAKIIDSSLCDLITGLALSMTKQQRSSDFSAEDDIEFLEVTLLQFEKFSDEYIPVQILKKSLLATKSDIFIELSENNDSNRWIGSWLKRMNLVHNASVQKKRDGENLRCYKVEKSKVLHLLEALKG